MRVFFEAKFSKLFPPLKRNKSKKDLKQHSPQGICVPTLPIHIFFVVVVCLFIIFEHETNQWELPFIILPNNVFRADGVIIDVMFLIVTEAFSNPSEYSFG